MTAKLKLSTSLMIFGSMGLVVRLIDLPTAWIAAGRGAIGVLFLGLTLLLMKTTVGLEPLRLNLRVLLFSGVALGGSWIFLFEAYKRTTIANASLSYYLAPVFVVLLSPLVLREKLTARKLLCVGISMFGMALVSGVGGGSADSGSLLGIGCGLTAALGYTALIFLNKFLRDIRPLDATFAQLAVACVVLVPYALLADGLPGNPGTVSLLLLLVLGVVHTSFAFAFYFSGVRELGTGSIAVLSYIDPIFSILLSALLLGERMTGLQIMGAVCILGATLVSELLDLKTAKTPQIPDAKAA